MGNICENKCYCNNWLQQDIIGTYTYYPLSFGKFKSLNICQCCCLFGCNNKCGHINTNKYPKWKDIKDIFEMDYLQNADLLIQRPQDCDIIKQLLENEWIQPTNSFLRSHGFECYLLICNKWTVIIGIKQFKQER